MEQSVYRVLLELGVNPRHKAMRYLCALVELAAYGSVFPLSKRGYPHIACEFRTSVQCVDKAIQNTIARAWTHGDSERLYAAFGDRVDKERGKPTAVQFIREALARVYEKSTETESDGLETREG